MRSLCHRSLRSKSICVTCEAKETYGALAEEVNSDVHNGCLSMNVESEG